MYIYSTIFVCQQHACEKLAIRWLMNCKLFIVVTFFLCQTFLKSFFTLTLNKGLLRVSSRMLGYGSGSGKCCLKNQYIQTFSDTVFLLEFKFLWH